MVYVLDVKIDHNLKITVPSELLIVFFKIKYKLDNGEVRLITGHRQKL